MSIPAFAWAMQRGRELKLPTGLRMLLIAIADRGNGNCACFAGQECLAGDTGLTSRHVRDLAPKLEELGLIRMERRGRLIYYHVLRPQVAEASSGNGRAKPEAGSAKHRKPVPETSSANGSDTGTQGAQYRNSVPRKPEASSDQPVLNQESNLKSAQGAPKEGKILKFSERRKGRAPPSTPPPDATTDGGDAFAGSDEAKAWMSRQLGRTVRLAIPEPDAVTEDDTPQTDADSQRMAEQLAGLAKSLAHNMRIKAYPPGRPPQRDRWDQIAAAEGRPLVGEILSPFRPQDPERTVEQQLAELERMMRAEAAQSIAAE